MPVPTLGLKSLLGVAVTLPGLQMLAGKRSAWLPHRFLRSGQCPDRSLQAACLGERFLPRLQRFIKPRIAWMSCRSGAALPGLAVIITGLLMMLPLPETKTYTGLVLPALSLGLIESDGLMTLLVALAALVMAALYTEAVCLLTILLTA